MSSVKFPRSLAEFNAQYPTRDAAAFENANQELIERMIEVWVKGAPNLFVVARALRTALQEDWERAELATLLTEEVI